MIANMLLSALKPAWRTLCRAGGWTRWCVSRRLGFCLIRPCLCRHFGFDGRVCLVFLWTIGRRRRYCFLKNNMAMTGECSEVTFYHLAQQASRSLCRRRWQPCPLCALAPIPRFTGRGPRGLNRTRRAWSLDRARRSWSLGWTLAP